MNDQIFEQLSFFNRTVVLPTFDLIEQELAALGYQVSITQSLRTSEDPFAEMVQGLSRPWNASFLVEYDPKAHEQPRRWTVAVLMVQRSDVPDVLQRRYEDKFCCGVQCIVRPERGIYAVFAVTYMKLGEKVFEYSEHTFAGREQQEIAVLRSADLLTQFLALLTMFQRQAVTAEVQPQESVLAVIAIVPPEQTLTSELPTVSAPPEPVLPIASKAAQRAEVKSFLASLNLKQRYAVEQLYGFTLSRSLEWACKVGNRRAQLQGEARQVYDWFLEQGAEFAESLQPNSVVKVLDYMQLYEAVLDQDCRRVLEPDPSQPKEQVWMAQARAAGTPENPGQLTAIALREMRFVYQSLARRFGQPDALGQLDLIGSCEVYLFDQTPATMIRQVQVHAGYGRLRFENLSWAVLQVYQNAGYLPEDELRARRKLVYSYIYSLRLTVEHPTEEVLSTQNEGGDERFRFWFRRRLADGRLAEAVVGVFGGRVELLFYRFMAE